MMTASPDKMDRDGDASMQKGRSSHVASSNEMKELHLKWSFKTTEIPDEMQTYKEKTKINYEQSSSVVEKVNIAHTTYNYTLQ